jgi:hypothetical protein
LETLIFISIPLKKKPIDYIFYAKINEKMPFSKILPSSEQIDKYTS